MSDHANKIKDIIEKELGVEREKLTPEASFIEDLGADSLDIVEIVSSSMREIKVKIPRSELAKLTNLDALVDLLHTTAAGKSA